MILHHLHKIGASCIFEYRRSSLLDTSTSERFFVPLRKRGPRSNETWARVVHGRSFSNQFSSERSARRRHRTTAVSAPSAGPRSPGREDVDPPSPFWITIYVIVVLLTAGTSILLMHDVYERRSTCASRYRVMYHGRLFLLRLHLYVTCIDVYVAICI